MIILWDENKRKTNLEKHGLDFADLTLEFIEYARLEPAHSNRFKAINNLNNITISVVFRPYGREALKVISMRPANKKREQFR
jgi:uncharacterized protein